MGDLLLGRPHIFPGLSLAHTHISSSSGLFPIMPELTKRHLRWDTDEAKLLAGVAGMSLCCPSGALLLNCDLSPGSGHILLTLARVGWIQVPLPLQLIYYLNQSCST